MSGTNEASTVINGPQSVTDEAISPADINIEESAQSVADSAMPDSDAEDSGEEGGTDYAALARADARELRGEFPELSSLSSITELDDPIRYGALRDLGLTPAEAYLATKKRRESDNRSHLRPTRSVARGAAPLMTEAEMSAARELFSGISDSEIRQLYKRVTK